MASKSLQGELPLELLSCQLFIFKALMLNINWHSMLIAKTFPSAYKYNRKT